MEQASCLLRENGAIYSTFRYARYIVLVGTLREPIGVNLRSNPVIDCCLTTKSRSPLTPRAVSFSDKSSFCRVVPRMPTLRVYNFVGVSEIGAGTLGTAPTENETALP